MTFVSLLCIIALMSYVALAVRLLSKRPRTALNWTCVFVLLGLAAWSIEDIVHGFPMASPGLVRLFGNIGSLGWTTFSSLNLAFVLVFTHRRHLLRKWFVYLPLAALPLLLISAQLSGRLVADYTSSINGWRTVWSTSAWPMVFNVYYLSFTLLALGLVFLFWRKAKFLYERKQARIILATGLVGTVLGSATDVILPRIADPSVPELAIVFILLWAGGIYYAVTRYGMMSVTPQAAADDILATMPDALLLLGPDGEFVRTNQAALDLFGYPAGELTDKHAELLFAEPATYHAAIDRIAGGEPVSALEFDCRTRDGKLVPVNLSGRVMRDRGDETVGIVLVLQDITERRLADARLRQVQQELVVREKLATLGQVAGSVAHEIRNPLGAIRNAAYFLKLTAGDKLAGKAAKHLEIINDEINRCNRIITSLLDFVQGRACEPHACSLADIVSKATAQAELPRMTEVQTRLPDDLPLVRVDAGQMEQVFRNLITNAHQAMAAGGKVTIAAARTNGVVRVAVSDSGSGITPVDRARLFEPLFSTKVVGVGLGLAICKSFTEANGGTISVETEVGKGTTVTVTLPSAEEQIPSAKHQGAGKPQSPRGADKP
jgi:PAS domain S-box-containing protein